MTKDILRVAAPLLVLAAGLAGFALFAQKAEPEQREQPVESDKKPVTQVVEEFDDRIVIEFDGVVVPYRQISVSAEIAGRVTSMSEQLRGGRFVSQGTKLIEIDPVFHELEVERLKAEKQQAATMVAELEDELQFLKDELIPNARQQKTLEESEREQIRLLRKQKVATAADLIPYERNVLTAENSLDTLAKQALQLEHQIAQNKQKKLITQAKLKQAVRDLEMSTLSAPIDGLIVDEMVEEGSFVQRGTELYLLEDTSQVEISSNLTMAQFGWLLQSPKDSSEAKHTVGAAYQLEGIDVTVSYDLAGEVYHWDGRFSRLAGTGVDPGTRTIPCRVTVPEPRRFRVGDSPERTTARSPRTLLNGMFVEMTAEIAPDQKLLEIPEDAVRPGNSVLKYSEGEASEVISVNVLHRQNGKVLILAEGSSLQEGDELIVSPLSTPAARRAVDSDVTVKTARQDVAEGVR